MRNHTIDNETLSDADELNLSAYNAAFYELGLRWYWDIPTYQALFSDTNGEIQILKYIKANHPHLLSAYDAGFLVDLIQEAKVRCHDRLIAGGTGIMPVADWAAMQVAQVGF